MYTIIKDLYKNVENWEPCGVRFCNGTCIRKDQECDNEGDYCTSCWYCGEHCFEEPCECNSCISNNYEKDISSEYALIDYFHDWFVKTKASQKEGVLFDCFIEYNKHLTYWMNDSFGLYLEGKNEFKKLIDWLDKHQNDFENYNSQEFLFNWNRKK